MPTLLPHWWGLAFIFLPRAEMGQLGWHVPHPQETPLCHWEAFYPHAPGAGQPSGRALLLGDGTESGEWEEESSEGVPGAHLSPTREASASGGGQPEAGDSQAEGHNARPLITGFTNFSEDASMVKPFAR